MSTIAMDAKSALLEVVGKIIIPNEYGLRSCESKQRNGEDVWVFRFEKASGQNNGLFGEHFTIVVKKSNSELLGLTWMDESFASGRLPDNEEATKIAMQFLTYIKPGSANTLKNLWIDLHNETITLSNGNKVLIPGVKYKCHCQEDDSYTWVIVGSGGRILTFEQEVFWKDGRVTEKWLHDISCSVKIKF